jgi:hypothetical protein
LIVPACAIASARRQWSCRRRSRHTTTADPLAAAYTSLRVAVPALNLDHYRGARATICGHSPIRSRRVKGPLLPQFRAFWPASLHCGRTISVWAGLARSIVLWRQPYDLAGLCRIIFFRRQSNDTPLGPFSFFSSHRAATSRDVRANAISARKAGKERQGPVKINHEPTL